MKIKDGKGKGNEAGVNSENQLLTASVGQSEIEHESEENGAAYNWSSDLVSLDAADTVLLLKNTSDTPLHIEYVDINSGVTPSEYTVHLPTADVTVAGATTITGVNLNTASSNVAEASSVTDETGNTQGNVIASAFLAADSNIRIATPGLILGKNKSLAIDAVNTTTEAAATIVGHYAD